MSVLDKTELDGIVSIHHNSRFDHSKTFFTGMPSYYTNSNINKKNMNKAPQMLHCNKE
jgi:hypothetical protein